MKRPLTLLTALLLALLLAPLAALHAADAPTQKPNILLIVSDDQGYADFSRNGTGQVDTPHLDRLAAESRVFDRFYVEPACAPTRASLLTGRSFIRTGVWNVHFGGDYIGLEETLLPQILKGTGYQTALIGKWHSGKTPGYLPHQRGFDFALPVTMHKHVDNDFTINDAPLQLARIYPYEAQTYHGWTADHMADEAVRYLEAHRTNPFFLQLAYVSPHSPWDAPPQLIQKYLGRGQNERFAALNGLIEHLDASIGRVLAGLERLGLSENTIVLFLSDNGFVHKNEGRLKGELTPAEIAQRNPLGLRGTKGTIYEGGIRSPLFVRWPARIQPGTTQWLAHVTDILPTLAEVAGMPAAQLPARLDGRSFLPALLDVRKSQPPARVIFGSRLEVPARDRTPDPPLATGRDLAAEHERLDYAVANLYARDDRFKLIKEGAKVLALYDLIADPKEKTNVAADFPQDVRRLETALRAWFDDVLKNETPYTSPTFVVGREPGTVLHFNGAWKLTGDMQGADQWAHSLSATRTGAAVEWHVKVEKPGLYNAWLQADVEGPRRVVALTAGETKLEAKLVRGKLHELGRLPIPAGLQTLTFTLQDPVTGPQPGITKLWNIVLEPDQP